MMFSCVIMNEDAATRKVFEEHITALPGISLFGSFSSMEDAKAYLDDHTVDVLFIDIKMKDIVDMHKDKFMQPPPALVFTTDDPSHAMIGFEMDAVDFLVTPFTFERFIRTADKIERRINPVAYKAIPANQPDQQYFFIKTDQNFTKIELNKIRYVEGLENYVRIYCENKTVLTLSTMKNIEALLGAYHFLRIHRSYIVNLDKVESVLNYNFYVGDKVLPIGRSYRKSITDILKHSYSFKC